MTPNDPNQDATVENPLVENEEELSPEESFGEMIRSLDPVFQVDSLAANTLAEMGLGEASATPCEDGDMQRLDFSVLHFVLIPEKATWLDFMLEADRASIGKIFEMFSGISEAADEDLEDMLRETMNLIHGSLKSAFKSQGIDVIIPVVPQSVASNLLSHVAGGVSVQSRHLLKVGDISLRMTMIARPSPLVRKKLADIGVANVLAEALKPDDNDEIVLINRGTMINSKLLRKVHDLAEYDSEGRKAAVFEPSPLARLVK
ncbi:MAG: hypothetical protein D6781_12075 [Verrucomicrobia bacterium]|nr:MAG: hypothetical protein D6781_12075 [Verrucomicrobiota bacterium]